MKKTSILLILLLAGFAMLAQAQNTTYYPILQKEYSVGDSKSEISLSQTSRNVIFSHGFETPEGNGFEEGWTTIPTPGGNAWSREPYWLTDMIQQQSGGGRYARILSHNNVQHNAWLITPEISLTQGKTYQITFLLTMYGMGSVKEKLELKIGKSPTAAGMTNLLFTSIDVVDYYQTEVSVNFSPTDNDEYFIGWHAISPADGHFIMIDDVLVVEVAGNDLQNITDYQYSQVPVTQTLPAGKVKNIGGTTQTNIVLTAEMNGTPVGTSAPLSSLAPEAIAELSLSSPVYIPYGQNIMAYTFTQDEEESTPEDNVSTFYYKGTNNLFAIDEVVYLFDFFPVISTTWIAYGNIFNINKPVTLSQVNIGFGHAAPIDYSVSLYTMTGELQTAATPIFTQTAVKDPVYGFACLNVPATPLAPGNYYLCINQPNMNYQMGVAFDGNPEKITWGRNSAGSLTRVWEYGAAAIRMVFEVTNCAAPTNLSVIPDYHSAVFSWEGDAPIYKLTLNDGTADYFFYTQDNTITIGGMEEGGNITFNWSVTSICDANHSTSATGTPFVTLTCQMVTSFPFDENFDLPSIPSFPPPCWTIHNITGYERTWERSNEIPYSSPSCAFHPLNLVYYLEGLLVTPQLQITSDSYVLEFMSSNAWEYYHVYGGVWVSTTTNEPEAFTEIKQLEGDEISFEWKKITVPLHQFSGENIYIGFKYAGADGDEWMIDDVRVVNYASFIDGELAEIITPNTGDNLTANEPVKVLIKNNGGEPLSGFSLTLKVNGVDKATETFSGSVPNFGEAEYTFNTKLDLSALGAYEITVSLNITGDAVPANNTKTKTIGSFSSEIVKLYAYRLRDNAASPPDGFISFYSNNPAEVTCINDYVPAPPADAMYAGEHIDGYFYASTVKIIPGWGFNPISFVKISTETWTEVAVNPQTTCPIDMAYDYTTNTMFGIYSTSAIISNLVTVNLTTGDKTTVGQNGRFIIALACSPEGNLYGIDDRGNFCSINKTTGASTLISDTGIEPWYFQSMAFDQNTGRLFWAMCNTADEGKLIEIEPISGIIFDRGSISGNAQLIGLYSIIGEIPEQYMVTVLANPEEGGTVTGGGSYLLGATATVLATPNTKYEFVNWTKDSEIVSGDSSYSFPVTQEVTLTANFKLINKIFSYELPADFTLYPNPAKDILKIVRSTADKAQIEIYNIVGVKVQTLEMNGKEVNINVAKLPAGIYLVRLVGKQTVSVQRFVKE